MSSILLHPAGFVRLASELAYRAEDSNHSMNFACREFIGIAHSEADDAHPAASLICQELFDMNVQAVNERYEKHETGIKLSFVQMFPEWSDMQLLKHLLCLRYQSAEGDVYESALYNRLDAFCGKLAIEVIGDSPDYNALSWGWPDEVIEPQPIIKKKGKPFSLGQVFITPGATTAIVEAGQKVETFLRKHLALEQGELGTDDHELNLAAAHSGDDRILSKFKTDKDESLYLITEYDRSATTILLPSEY